MKLHLFNPENDLALGLGCRHYTPPPHAAAIHRAGALLPMWWAGEDDAILAPVSLESEAQILRDTFGLHGIIHDGHVAEEAEPTPWGWSADAKRQFLSAGVSEDRLPTDSRIEQLRQLSHRRMSIKILNSLDGDFPLPLETVIAEKVVETERKQPGCFIKSPWSGSGRGVFCARSLDEAALRRRAEGIIHRQGSVMVERGLDKVLDFAVLFYCEAGRARFRGLSVFQTEARGMYSGNIVAQQETLRAYVCNFIARETLDGIIRQEEDILSDLIGGAYCGWTGVDMMIYRDSGQMKIMPCVELNLRMTMGVVAMKIQEKLSLDSPAMMTWKHGADAAWKNDGTLLLPPSDGFALCLHQLSEGFQY